MPKFLKTYSTYDFVCLEISHRRFVNDFVKNGDFLSQTQHRWVNNLQLEIELTHWFANAQNLSLDHVKGDSDTLGYSGQTGIGSRAKLLLDVNSGHHDSMPCPGFRASKTSNQRTESTTSIGVEKCLESGAV